MEVGLALSGGAARGAAHIGVLKCLEERRLKPAFLAGTSAGSIIASFYCAGLSVFEIEAIALNLKWANMLKLTVPRLGLVNSTYMVDFICKTIGKLRFSDLKIPLAITAVDLVSGEEIVLQEGSVAEAVQASCAIPGIFTPVKRGTKMLVDGGLICNVPSRALQNKGLDYIIAVDLNAERVLTRQPQNIFEVIMQSYDIVQKLLDEDSHQYADLVVQPALGDISAWDIGKAKVFIQRGYNACVQALDSNCPLKKVGKKSFLARLFGLK